MCDTHCVVVFFIFVSFLKGLLVGIAYNKTHIQKSFSILWFSLDICNAINLCLCFVQNKLKWNANALNIFSYVDFSIIQLLVINIYSFMRYIQTTAKFSICNMLQIKNYTDNAASQNMIAIFFESALYIKLIILSLIKKRSWQSLAMFSSSKYIWCLSW